MEEMMKQFQRLRRAIDLSRYISLDRGIARSSSTNRTLVMYEAYIGPTRLVESITTCGRTAQVAVNKALKKWRKQNESTAT